jgi:glycosyltransferase involved in cell wall biosynthesis
MTEISLIIPIYNVEQYIGRCMEAVLCQTYKNYEVILVDDGSTDNSLLLARNMLNLSAYPIRLLFIRRTGVFQLPETRAWMPPRGNTFISRTAMII